MNRAHRIVGRILNKFNALSALQVFTICTIFRIVLAKMIILLDRMHINRLSYLTEFPKLVYSGFLGIPKTGF